MSEPTTPQPHAGGDVPGWWLEARFGMFIHWGVYSVHAGEYRGRAVAGASEWLMASAQVPVADYKEFAAGFHAAAFDPRAWVRTARDAGMGYMVITAKHHDGFAMFQTKASNWNVVEAAPAGRDLLRELADACREAHMPLGFYYSHAQDWANGGAFYGDAWDPVQETDFDSYLDRIAIPQIQELLTNYQPDTPALLWWDTPAKMTRERAARVDAAIQCLSPGILQNDRLGGEIPGSFETPEQRIPTRRPERPWETCMTTNESWGFNRNDQNWKSPDTLIRQLCEVVSQGGNYLLNVGPDSDGAIPAPTLAALAEVGKWMRANGEAIRGAGAGPFPHRLPWGFASRKGETIYLLVEQWPTDGCLRVPLLDAPCSARLLSGRAGEILVEEEPGGLNLRLPESPPQRAVSVISLSYHKPPRLGEVPPIPRPPILPQPADGAMVLRAADVELFGAHIALSTGNESHIGCWSSMDSYPLWRIRITKPGTCLVEVEYAAPRHREGTLAEVVIGESRLPLVVSGTGGWGEFRRVAVGLLRLEAHDELPVRILPRMVPHGAVMNLKAVYLTPT